MRVLVLLHRSKFDHSRHQRITLLFIIGILNSKYLNDDEDEGEKKGSKHTRRRDAICFLQTASAHKEKEQFTQSFIKQRERERKVDIYQEKKILLNW